MNYSLLIEERKSTRAFRNKPVTNDIYTSIKKYHDEEVMRLINDIKTEIIIAGADKKETIESAAGYKEFLEGMPSYIILLSEEHEHALLNAGYITEDISLKLNELGCGTCFVTFTDSDAIKNAAGITSDKKVCAVLAFGLTERKRKKMHFNVFTMSGISAKEKQQYYAPKKSVEELTFLDKFGNKDGLFDYIDSHDDILWDVLMAASNSPSYMNRQPYCFVINENNLNLLSLKDEFTGPIDEALNLGVVMLHVAAGAAPYRSNLVWDVKNEALEGLPDDVRLVATFEI